MGIATVTKSGLCIYVCSSYLMKFLQVIHDACSMKSGDESRICVNSSRVHLNYFVCLNSSLLRGMLHLFQVEILVVSYDVICGENASWRRRDTRSYKSTRLVVK